MLNPLKWLRRGKPDIMSLGVAGKLGGKFDLRGDRLAGWVSPEYIDARGSLDIEVQRRGRTVASCQAPFNQVTNRFEFVLPVEGRFDIAEMLDDVLEVTARTANGDTGTLTIDGATQLELIRAHLGVPAEVLVDLDFTRGGNAKPYLGEGWSDAENDYTWTNGAESVVTFDSPGKPGTYSLRVTAGAYVRGEELNRQDAKVFVNDEYVATFVITGGANQYDEVKLRGELFAGRPKTTVRFQHLYAKRPSDFGHKDQRLLAMHFKRLTLVRLLEPEPDA